MELPRNCKRQAFNLIRNNRFFCCCLVQALLYLISLLDPLVKGDYIILYFHTLTEGHNHPSMTWMREVYNVLEYKHKKNLKGFYIIHPTFWTKVSNIILSDLVFFLNLFHLYLFFVNRS
jgi:predicted tellurium resistance membrane protein TerC